jgi:hypothetical protein
MISNQLREMFRDALGELEMSKRMRCSCMSIASEHDTKAGPDRSPVAALEAMRRM